MGVKNLLKKHVKRAIAIILALCMVLELCPQSVYASELGVEAAQEEVSRKTYTDENCTITYEENSAWSNYVNVNITIENNSDADKSLWKLDITYDGHIDNIWNADIVSSENGKYAIAAKSYNSTIPAGQSVSFGFLAYGDSGKPAAPKAVTFAKGTGSTTDLTQDDGADVIDGQTYTIPEKWKGLEYVLFTSDDSGIALYTNTTKIKGSVHSNGDFFYQGNSIDINGVLEAANGITLRTSGSDNSQDITSKLENADKLDMPVITEEVYSYIKENGTVYKADKSFDSDNVSIDTPIVIDGSAHFNATTFLGKGIIYAKDSITYNVASISTPEDSRVFIASETGDITLNGSNITLNAVLYAPNGTVNINANEFHLNGRIIAKAVNINGTRIEINAGPYDLDMLDFLFKPEIDVISEGNLKENRKVVLSIEEILNTEYIIKEDTQWSITKDGEDASALFAVDEEESNYFHKEMIFKEAGAYTVAVTVTTGKVDYTVTKELVIEKDLEPVAGFDLESNYYGRDENGNASISLSDTTMSPDGDTIGQRVWTVYYDKNNDGIFAEDEAEIISDGNETEITYTTNNVGNYRVVLFVKETYEDTIPKLLADSAYLSDDTTDFEADYSSFEVGNEAPVAKLDVEKSKSADIVFTVGDTDKESLDIYQSKAEELKQILADKGVDANIDAVSTKTYTAQDTFAWKEYSHYNCDGYAEHIIYEEDSIKMIGYQSKAIKDFLYLPDENPNRKVFEFDLQRDYNNWHSMEGGGFLFNATVDDDANTIQGFCILVAQAGLKLVQIDCKNLKEFCNGRYGYVQNVGKLLNTYKISNLYDLHHFKIVVDSKTISVWDGDKLVIDDYVLPENDYGYGFGPIISHASHGCSQRSYFTFQNITMETMSGSSLSDIVNGYEWRAGASHYVINLSDTEVPELSSDESTADLARALLQNNAAFIGMGNDTNEMQYNTLLNAVLNGGMNLDNGDITSACDTVNHYITDTILSKDYTIYSSITTDDIVTYKDYYQDAENDSIYEQQWEYEYVGGSFDLSQLSELQGDTDLSDENVFVPGTTTLSNGHILRRENEPIYTFDETGAYAIRVRIQDDPTNGNEAVAVYRKWSDTNEYQKLLIVQSRPTASITADIIRDANDNTKCTANVTYSAEDEDHLEDADKGIRQEYFAYKKVTDGGWTEGKLPNKLEIGDTYLVLYKVRDIEGAWSFPVVAVIKTNDLREYEPVVDNLPPTVYIDVAKTTISVGETLLIEGYALDDHGIDSYELYVDGEKVLDTFGRTFYTGLKEGVVKVRAVAADIGGNTAEKEIEITVVDDRDVTPPVAEIISPSAGSELGFNIEFKGTAKDETALDSYTLAYRRSVAAGNEENEYITFAEGSSEIDRDTLGTLDISGFRTGLYDILLTVKDKAGNISYYGMILYIEEGAAEEYTITGNIIGVGFNDDKTGINITGTAAAEGHLSKYELYYAADTVEDNNDDDNEESADASSNVTGNTEETEYIKLAEGTDEITEGILGTLAVDGLNDGSYKLRLVVEDTNGNSVEATGGFKYTAGKNIEADTEAPKAEITRLALSEDTSEIEIKISVSDDKELAGYKLEYAKKSSNDFMLLVTGTEPVNDEKVAAINTEALSDGTYTLKLTAEDSFGNRTIYTVDFMYKKGTNTVTLIDADTENNQNTGKQFALNLSYSRATIGTEVKIQVTLADGMSAEKIALYKDDEELSIGTITGTFTSDKVGKVIIKAVYKEDDGEEQELSQSCTFYNSSDKIAPTVNITSPDFTEALTEPVDIVGSAYDETELDYYKLEYKPAGETDYQTLTDTEDNTDFDTKEGIQNGVLGVLDTTLLMNGKYELRLTACDKGGNITRLTQEFVVEGNLKVGAMHIGFTDITASLGGTTVNVLRTYDSRNKTKGDFGYGWSLGMQGMELYESGNIAEGYEVVQTGSRFSTAYQMTETTNHDVVVCYGDGTSDRFELTFSPERQAFFPIIGVTLGYRCVTNQKVKLEIVGDTTAYVSGNQLLFNSDSMYDTLSYKLTTEEGIEIYLRSGKGVYKIVDSNGNIITVDESGYHSEDGRSITFERDDEDRVVSATNPAGGKTTYEYNEAGDLVAVTDCAERTVTFAYDKEHNLISITDPSGIAVSRNEYDDDGRLVATIDAEGNRMEYEHDVDGRTELITDRLGNKTLYVYDDNGNVLSTTDANGNTTKSTYDAYGNVLTKTDAMGNVSSYTYDENGNMISATDVSGNSITNTYNDNNLITSMKSVNDTEILIDYDENGYMSATTDAEGNITTYDSDRRGNVTGMADGIGSVMSAKYDKEGNVIETEDSAGNKTVNTYDEAGNRITQTTYVETEEGTVERTTRYIYNDSGELVQTIDADGNSTSVERNENGKMSASVDSKGRRTEYEYDAYGNVSEIRYSDGTKETYEYDAEGRNTKTTNRLGLSVTYTYDKVGNLLKKTDARGNVTSYTYDKNYNLLTVTSPTGAVTTYTYDELNRNTAIEDAEGNVTQFTYDELSLQTSTTDAKGNVTSYEYDKNGNRTKVIYPDGTYIETTYDERGRIISQQDTAERKTEYIYDGSDRLTQVKQNNGSVTSYTYDRSGNLTGITDANGNITLYEYDENGRRVKTILADGAESTSSYDSYGMPVSATDYNGVTSTYTYDEEDRIIKEITGEEKTEYTYDSFGRLTDIITGSSHITYSYNEYGELSGKTYENGQSIAYGYDSYGRINEISVSVSDKEFNATRYEYDTMDRLTRVIAHDGTAIVYTYDENGNRKTATYANGQVISYSYDEMNRLILQKVVDRDGNIITQYEYTLGKGGERTHVTESGTTEDAEASYNYDKAGRLIEEVIETENKKTTYEYEYDAVGNRLSKVADGSKTSYTYNSRNQLIKESSDTGSIIYSYDANGNLLNAAGKGTAVTYTYDVYNRLVGYTDGSHKETYTYDAEGVRRSKTNGEESLIFISDTTGSLSQTLAETDEEGNLIAAYTRADTLISQVRDGEVSYYLYDGHGDVRALSDDKGNITDTYRYNAYGELLEKEGDTENHYLYTGEYYDGASDLYYLRARYMNPSTGTFISMDTYEGSIYDPDTLHKYLYANGNPVTYSDPSGNMFSIAEGAISAGIQSVFNNMVQIMYNGVISGLVNMIFTCVMGGSWEETKSSFVTGFILGAGLSAIRYFVVGAKLVTLARFYVLSATASFIFNTTITIFAITQGLPELAVMSGVFAILSLVEWGFAYKRYLLIDVYGGNGGARLELDSSGSVPTEGQMHDAVTQWTRMEESLANSNRQLDKFNTASVVYDAKTGNYFYGMNRGIQLSGDKLNSSLSSWLPESSLNQYRLGNCAEVDAVNQALNAGANINDLYIYTINTKNNLPKVMCENCIYTFANRVAYIFSH